MQPTASELQARYASLDDDELLRIFARHSLTPLAQPILEQELAHRGIESPNAAFRQTAPLASSPSIKESLREALHPTLRGIRGWLLIPAIGMVFVPFLQLVFVILAVESFYRAAAGEYVSFYALALLFEISLMMFIVYTAVRFFAMKRNAPALVIAWLALGLAVSITVLGVDLSFGAKETVPASAAEFGRNVIVAAIWIPYFRMSKRVKATFVN